MTESIQPSICVQGGGAIGVVPDTGDIECRWCGCILQFVPGSTETTAQLASLSSRTALLEESTNQLTQRLATPQSQSPGDSELDIIAGDMKYRREDRERNEQLIIAVSCLVAFVLLIGGFAIAMNNIRAEQQWSTVQQQVRQFGD